jgi:N-acetylmuramoyl-L-alanine amidase
MKRLSILTLLLLLALATIVLAQTSGQATLRTPAGDHPFTYVEQSGHTYVSAGEVVTGLGGTMVPESSGYRVTINGVNGGFGPDSRFGVVRDDLIEMPVPPIIIEGQPFVPWQFFRGLVEKASGLDVTWDPATTTLTAKPVVREAVSVQASLANIQGTSKLVLTLSAPAAHMVSRDGTAYVVRFRAPLRPPFAQQTYDDPHVQRLTFGANELRIDLTGADVVGDAYELENPPRVVIDFRKGAAPSPDAPVQPRQQPQRLPGIRTIVIDPGHGGKEVGAVGPNGLLEKDVTLEIARKLGDSLARQTGARVVLTREDDSVVSLDQRTALANQYDADLFLSVHMNAAVAPHAKGSETYFLSLEATDEHARMAAERENTMAGSAAAGDDLQLILWDLAQQAYIHESSRFAQTIQEELNAATGVANRGVKQAPFKVLIGATMPAALVEVAFISNPEEEAKLQSAEFQSTMIDAITRAVMRYKTDYETRIGVIRPAAAPAQTAPAAPAAAASPTETER